jgi:single-strand DNA-binding protein
MANLNKVFLIGNLTKDVELRYTTSGQAVGSTGMGINRRWKSGEEMKEDTTFVNLVVWGKQSEVLTEYARKGSLIHVEGRLQNRSWEDKEGGKHSITEIVVDNFQLLDKKEKTEETKEE